VKVPILAVALTLAKRELLVAALRGTARRVCG